MVANYGLLSVANGVKATILPHRACEACKRKKTKCSAPSDMNRPICSLCMRTGSVCIFPTKRKRPSEDALHFPREKRAKELCARTDTHHNVEDDPGPAFLECLANYEEQNPVGIEISDDNLEDELQDQNQSRSGYDFTAAATSTQSLEPISIPSLSELFDIENFINLQNQDPKLPWSLPNHGLSHDFSVTDTITGSQNFAPLRSGSEQENFEYNSILPWNAVNPQQDEIELSESRGNDHLILTSSETCSLIDTYFDTIHACFPIMDQVEFGQTTMKRLRTGEDWRNLSAEEALVVSAMMALSARFSSLSRFSAIPRTKRGEPFARESGVLMTKVLLMSELDSTSPMFLRGCILSTVYWLTCLPNGKAWVLVGICVRIAYSLSLHTIDEDLRDKDVLSLSSDEWARREGLRRLWWAVVECDNFASMTRCRPVSIDRDRVHVLFPSPDQDWYARTPQKSAFLDENLLESWRELKSSTNRSPYAWYLLINHFVLKGHEMSLQKKTTEQQRQDLEDIIQCVAMGLPDQFSLHSDAVQFDEFSHSHDNWIIFLHLMLQCALVYVMGPPPPGLLEDIGPQESPSSEVTNTSSTRTLFMESSDSIPDSMRYRSTLNNVIKAIRIWSPHYCMNSQPFIVYTLLGPYAMHLRATFRAPNPEKGALERDMIRETLARIAKYWDLGNAALDTMNNLIARFSSSDTLAAR